MLSYVIDNQLQKSPLSGQVTSRLAHQNFESTRGRLASHMAQDLAEPYHFLKSLFKPSTSTTFSTFPFARFFR